MPPYDEAEEEQYDEEQIEEGSSCLHTTAWFALISFLWIAFWIGLLIALELIAEQMPGYDPWRGL